MCGSDNFELAEHAKLSSILPNAAWHSDYAACLIRVVKIGSHNQPQLTKFTNKPMGSQRNIDGIHNVGSALLVKSAQHAQPLLPLPERGIDSRGFLPDG
jgi:hypothetical protein